MRCAKSKPIFGMFHLTLSVEFLLKSVSSWERCVVPSQNLFLGWFIRLSVEFKGICL